MKNKNLVLFVLLFLLGGELTSASAQGKSGIYKPWSHGRLKVSKENRYLMNADGTPFFWLGDTGWLLPEKLNRDEAAYYLEHCRQAGFNVVQVQTINGVPAMNFYGQYSMIDGFNFKNIDRKGVYGYWDHMDYIIQKAEQNGIYIAMVCIWGGLVRSGKMNVEEAKAYGKFLGERYKDAPNIIWVIGGDTYADRNTEIWEALANSILAVDKNHIMTFHPFGRTSSAAHLNNKEWMDMAKGFGGRGGMGGMGMNANMLKQAQKMQADMEKTQAELQEKEYTATAGGGVVSATVDGKHMVKAITIDPEAVDPDDVEMLQDMVIAAVNEAIRNAMDDMSASMGKITGGMNLPF